jgi:HD superfamily phosphohydrolase
MNPKIFRDPLYNYISIDRDTDQWLLDLLDSPEMQRLRRIHQLGVSSLTYPGADHSRLCHSLGVLHLMQQALAHLGPEDRQVGRGRDPLLAAALLHDVGHGPFSHVFEPCLGTKHEEWSRRVILSRESQVNRVLRDVDPDLPRVVAALIDEDNKDYPVWQKNLLSSQLDVDRLDYLRRDSLFTGAGYGHFDWYRILHSFRLAGPVNVDRDLVWDEKSALAIEEYIFARFYMYWNVYFYKTTRGFEKMLVALWQRARTFHDAGTDVFLLPTIRDFWAAPEPSVRQYLAIEEFTVLSQIQAWAAHLDKALSDLARRFLARERFVAIETPDQLDVLGTGLPAWEEALKKLVGSRLEYQPAEMYCLPDNLQARYNQPYLPEKESEEQGVGNAIRLWVRDQGQPVEISERLPRLQAITERPKAKYRYYVPKDLEVEANELRTGWKQTP